MTPDPRCGYPECDKLAAVWWRGPWCGQHSLAQYGRLPRSYRAVPELAFRFAEIHRQNVAAANSDGATVGNGRLGNPPFRPVPSSGGTAIMGGSLPVGEPSPPHRAGKGSSVVPGGLRELGSRTGEPTDRSGGGSEPVDPAMRAFPALLSEAELLDILDRENWGTDA